MRVLHTSLYSAALGVCTLAPAALGQERPWLVFIDSQSNSQCGIINVANAQFVLVGEQLVSVNGPDNFLPDLRVDSSDNVFFRNEPAGFIAFDVDGDGTRTVWWLTSATLRVVEIDDFTGEPTASDREPTDFTNVACDGCLLWDDRTDCQDADRPDSPGFRLCGNGFGGAAMIVLAVLGFTWRATIRVVGRSVELASL